MGHRDPLVELLDEGLLGDRTASRSRERAMRRAAEEGATLVGLLVDLAERGSSVVVHTVVGRRHHGVLIAVAGDHCILRTGTRSEPHLRLDAIASVRPTRHERHVVPAGDRPAVVDQLLIEVLGRMVDEHPRLVLVCRGGEQVAGTLRSVGADIVTLDLDGGREQLCCVAAAAVTEAVLDQ